MLSLTRKADYAIIALAHLAKSDGEVCTAREIAQKFQVPTALLMNVLKTLSHGDLVRSSRGARGGYALARPPEGITLEDILSVIEGPLRLALCSGTNQHEEDACELLHVCPVKRPVQRIHERLQQFLRQITLADIVRESADPVARVPLALHADSCHSSGCCGSTSAGGAGCAQPV